MIEIYTDGASRGNPGISGAGIYTKTAQANYEFAIPLANMTNHEAEFHAVIEALRICLDLFPGEILSFRSDAKVVVHAVENNYVKNVLFQPLLTEIEELSKYFPYLFMKWIPSKENYHADRLAKQAIQVQLGSNS